MAVSGSRAISIYMELYDRPYSKEEFVGEHRSATVLPSQSEGEMVIIISSRPTTKPTAFTNSTNQINKCVDVKARYPHRFAFTRADTFHLFAFPNNDKHDETKPTDHFVSRPVPSTTVW